MILFLAMLSPQFCSKVRPPKVRVPLQHPETFVSCDLADLHVAHLCALIEPTHCSVPQVMKSKVRALSLLEHTSEAVGESVTYQRSLLEVATLPPVLKQPLVVQPVGFEFCQQHAGNGHLSSVACL